jgi:hypothetical protein
METGKKRKNTKLGKAWLRLKRIFALKQAGYP